MDSGDGVLVSTAEALTRHFRDSDIIGRLSSNRFVVLGLQTTSTSSAILEKRFRDGLDQEPLSAPSGAIVRFCLAAGKWDPGEELSLENRLVELEEQIGSTQQGA